jgi:RNA polymerase-binding transcription factor DksA
MKRNDIDVATYEARLREESARLEKELATLGIRDPKTDDWQVTAADGVEVTADPNDRGDRFEEIEDRAAILNELEAQYDDVKRALAKIEDESYGYCEISGEPIEAGRLDANPAARTCVAHMNDK